MKSPFLKLTAALLPVIMIIVLFTYQWGHSTAQDNAVRFFSVLAGASIIYWIWIYLTKRR